MKVKYTTRNGRMSVEFDGEQKEIFEQIGKFQDVFEESLCGKCGSDNLKFVVRTVDDDLYYELRCLDCGAKLHFGVNKKGGTLFPKRKDKEGNWYDNRGWVKYNAKTGQNE